MSQVVEFTVSNFRLYDTDTKELRQMCGGHFVTSVPGSDGSVTHVVLAGANGIGKSTMLLFLELVFCKNEARFPQVGESGLGAGTFLQRLADELNDLTPTTVAVHVRRDKSGLMDEARDYILGLSVAHREGGVNSIDIQRFIIDCSQCPGVDLERLNELVVLDVDNACVLDTKSSREALRAIPGCKLYTNRQWDEYEKRLRDLGLSALFYREVAKMNAHEEAAFRYFSQNAFDQVVKLVSDARSESTDAEYTSPATNAVALAKNLSEQEGDRAELSSLETAEEALDEVREVVGEYAEEREAFQHDLATLSTAHAAISDYSKELSDEIDSLNEQVDGLDERRRNNECLRASCDYRSAEVIVGHRKAEKSQR